jgi:hypothetical protein
MTQMLSLGPLLRLARDTISDPREGATTVLSFAPPRQALWLMFALVVVLSLIMGELVALVSDLPDDGALTGPYQQSTLILGLLQGVFLFVMVHAITHIGRMFGGTGRFEEALLLMIWLQFIFLCVQVVQLVALLVIPPMAVLITILALGLFLWLLVNFIAVLHGFTSLGMVFVMTILSAFAIIFLLSVVLSILGITTGTGPV